jgi:hypothetical protein
MIETHLLIIVVGTGDGGETTSVDGTYVGTEAAGITMIDGCPGTVMNGTVDGIQVFGT